MTFLVYQLYVYLNSHLENILKNDTFSIRKIVFLNFDVL